MSCAMICKDVKWELQSFALPTFPPGTGLVARRPRFMAKGSSSDEDSIECLLCLSNPFKVDLCKWYQCPEGHLLCESCHAKVFFFRSECRGFAGTFDNRIAGRRVVAVCFVWIDCWKFSESCSGSVIGYF